MLKSRFRLVLLVLPLIPVFLYTGWKHWSTTNPQPLPQQSTIPAIAPLIPGRYYEASVPPTGKASYISADYRLWIPDGVSVVRGLLVRQHGCGDVPAATGLDYANDLQWQALAVKHQFALLGTKLPTGDRLCDDWATINQGSEAAFLKALQIFAQTSQHPELTRVPWALWGHSGGADWAAQMLQKYPERTIAVVAARCGASTFPDTINPALLKVPFLFAVAEKDDSFVDECRDLPKRVFLRYRKAGALWAIAEEIDTGHESGDTRLLALPYLDAAIAARLPATGSQLQPINPDQGWLATPSTRTITPTNQYQADPLEAAWLPNQETADKWQAYVTTGKILPSQRPAAPTNVRIVRVNESDIALLWRYTPDLENGLPSFRIYRNNSLIKTFKGQQHNFSDAPDPPHVALEFQDRAESSASYVVAAFNRLGESVDNVSVQQYRSSR